MDVTLENSNIKAQIRNLQQTYEASMDKLREKQRQLEVAQVENQLLKMKVKYRNVDFLLTFLSSSFLSSPIANSPISLSLFSSLLGFPTLFVANPTGFDLNGLRGFLCSQLPVQIGGTLYIPLLGSPALDPVASRATETSSWHCSYVLRGHLGCAQVRDFISFTVYILSEVPRPHCLV